MSGYNFASAPTEQGDFGDLIPNGTLAWAIFKIRPFNLDMGLIEKQGKTNPENQYLDVELTILEGRHARRKVWDIIGVAGSEGFVKRGFAAIRHILETGLGASPTNPNAYVIPTTRGQDGAERGNWLVFDEKKVAIKIGVEIGKADQNGNKLYADKNIIRAYLSPNPESDSFKDYQRLLAGDTEPKGAAAALKPATSPVAQSPTAGWATAPTQIPSATVAVKSPGAPVTQKPAWLK